jgi:hypothetical protein
MSRYGSYSDDYYINMNLNTEMDLPPNRETVLHYFEQVQKQYPAMRNFYGREKGEYVLEEDKDRGQYRWTSIEPRRISSGQVNPASAEEAFQQHALVLDYIPHLLSVSPLDCETLNIMYGFDFTYRGNHNQLLAEALGIVPAFEKLTQVEGVTLVGHEPAIQLAFDSDCKVQCRIGVETRTSAYHIRTGEFPEEQLTVYLTARRYGSLEPGETYVSTLNRLVEVSKDLVDNFLVAHVLRPLQQAIAIQ